MSLSQEIKKYITLVESATASVSVNSCNKLYKIYSNSDGSASIVLESGDAFWFGSEFVQQYMLNENNKIDRELLSEVVRAVRPGPMPSIWDQPFQVIPPKDQQDRDLLASQIKTRREIRRRNRDFYQDKLKKDPNNIAAQNSLNKMPKLYGAASGNNFGVDGGKIPSGSSDYQNMGILTTKQPFDQQIDQQPGHITKMGGTMDPGQGKGIARPPHEEYKGVGGYRKTFKPIPRQPK